MGVNADTTRTAYTVSYESASQFSREYARIFMDQDYRAVLLRGHHQRMSLSAVRYGSVIGGGMIRDNKGKLLILTHEKFN